MFIITFLIIMIIIFTMFIITYLIIIIFPIL